MTTISCSSDGDQNDQGRKQWCATLCDQYDSMACNGPPESYLNPLSFVDEYAVGSCEYVCESGDAASLPECQAANDEFLECAATSGLVCGEDAYDFVRVLGCDEQAAILAEACGSCVSFPSGVANDCLTDQPLRYTCSVSSPGDAPLPVELRA